ncbi:MAG: serine--tRNA ligase [Alphaproteobacteria bacterium]
MYDIKWIRENPTDFDAALKRRKLAPLSSTVLELDKKLRASLTTAQDAQSKRNTLSKEIGLKKRNGENADDLMAQVETAKQEIETQSGITKEYEDKIFEILTTLPNIMDAEVPDGEDEDQNVECRVIGDKPSFSFTPKEHYELGENLGMMSFEAAAKLSGARFVVLKDKLARLERALAAFMLDLHTTEFGYTEVNPPFLVKDATAFGTGQLPKFKEDLFQTTDGFWLIPTAEVPLTNLAREEILDEKDLPLRFTAHTPCFRSEAGSAGKDTKGMLRQHQFSKVEMVSITTPEQSKAEHERMLSCAEEVLKRLGLHYRVVVLCSGDTGFCAQKTYDIEVWLPGQDTYREISSCSNCGDFQARRMKARYRPTGEKKATAVHTLNGSGLAVGRTLIAVLENYQQEDGSILIPEALQPYMNTLKKIEK